MGRPPRFPAETQLILSQACKGKAKRTSQEF